MKALLWPACLASLLLAGWTARSQSERWIVAIGGDSDGYLSPCGCTEPMSGGIRRKAAAIRSFGPPERTLVFENGGLAGGESRQDEIKAETAAEALRMLDVSAVGLDEKMAALGSGELASVQRLSGGAIVASQLAPSEAELAIARRAGPFLVGSLFEKPEGPAASLGVAPIPWERALASLVRQAANEDLQLAILFRGEEATARRMAESHPEVALIVLPGRGHPSVEPIRAGRAWIVQPGERGKSILRLSFENGDWNGFEVVDLGPQVRDDPEVAKLYARYQARVVDEKLIEMTPRVPTAPFAGSLTCATCHTRAGKVWQHSAHERALATLELSGHDRDPECVSCHVTGMNSTKGFRSRRETPRLTDVGCESCHGPSRDHARNPRAIHPPKVGSESCVPCHTPDNSPNFDFEAYWAKIRH